MSSPQLLDLLFDGSLNYLRHPEAFEVSDFSLFSNKIFKLPINHSLDSALESKLPNSSSILTYVLTKYVFSSTT
jgi:hypothetical protein